MTKERIRLLLGIALPIAMQNLINFAVNLMDTVMLGQLGEVPLAASSLANQVFFIVTLVVYGIGGGANVLAAQFWGKKDKEAIHQILVYTYRMTAAIACVITVAAICFPRQIMRLFTRDAAVITMGADYLRIVAWSYLFFAATTVTLCVLRAVHIVRIAMILSAISLCVNIGLNYILIFGKCGMPVLGIRGAAIATLCARAVESILLLIYIYKKERKLNLWRLFFAGKKVQNNRPDLFRIYISTSVPVILNELFWALGEAAVAMILGRLGTEIVSANAIYANISELSGVVVSGMNSAACVLVGNVIGQGNRRQLMQDKKLFQRVSVIVGLLGMAIMLLCRGFVIDLYKVTDITKMYAGQIMLIGSVVELCRSVQTMNMMGILRGGGDVRFAMCNDLIFLWGFTIPCGLIAALVLKWPVMVVYMVLKLDQCLKIFTSEYRLRTDKWYHMELLGVVRENEQ
ncbi:MAG: MATE family efflux transporter [Hespellia sp.]|nr:MATE family efflux transporter [Hespellia sp.]